MSQTAKQQPSSTFKGVMSCVYGLIGLLITGAKLPPNESLAITEPSVVSLGLLGYVAIVIWSAWDFLKSRGASEDKVLLLLMAPPACFVGYVTWLFITR
jgi:hypothetical protein